MQRISLNSNWQLSAYDFKMEDNFSMASGHGKTEEQRQIFEVDL